MGCSAQEKSQPSAPSVEATATTSSAAGPSVDAPVLPFGALSIMRSGNGYTLTGDLPNADVKSSLLGSLRTAFGPNVTLTDKLNIKPGVQAPEFSGLGALFSAAAEIPDFGADFKDGTVTLTGKAPSLEAKAAAAEAASATWSNVNVVNTIEVVSASSAAPTPR